MNEVFLIYETRGTIGITFIIYSNEIGKHNLPHLHAEYGEYNIVIGLDLIKVLENNLPKPQEKMH